MSSRAWADVLRLPELSKPSTCFICRRAFSHAAVLSAGHNKWSKIKHGKGVNDQKKNTTYNQFISSIVSNTRLYGPNPSENPALAFVLAGARKASVPKHVIEAAIARGQGRSASGASLENVTYEFMGPGSVGLIADIETDNRKRVQQDMTTLAKRHGAHLSSTEFLFRREGLTVFREKAKDADAGLPSEERPDRTGESILYEKVMDAALDLGAEDVVEDGEGNVLVFNEPTQLAQMGQKLSKELDLDVISSEMVWVPKEDTMMTVDQADDLGRLTKFVNALREFPDVQSVYANAAKGEVPGATWSALTEVLDN